MLIPLYQAKDYLRVDSSDEDELIGILQSTAQQMCVDVARISQAQWKDIDTLSYDDNGNLLPTESELYSEEELETLRATFRTAILYALGYLYKHREEADHHALMLTLRSLLFAVREGVF